MCFLESEHVCFDSDIITLSLRCCHYFIFHLSSILSPPLCSPRFHCASCQRRLTQPPPHQAASTSRVADAAARSTLFAQRPPRRARSRSVARSRPVARGRSIDPSPRLSTRRHSQLHADAHSCTPSLAERCASLLTRQHFPFQHTTLLQRKHHESQLPDTQENEAGNKLRQC